MGLIVDMSRSYKKTPIEGITYARSNKKFKQQGHRRERSTVKNYLRPHLAEDLYIQIPDTRNYGNEWASPRDGKTYFGHMKYYDCIDSLQAQWTFRCMWRCADDWHAFCNKAYEEAMRK